MEKIILITLCIAGIHLITKKIIKEFSDWEKDFSNNKDKNDDE